MAEHDIEKIVEAGGEVFNFRDPTKQPVADKVTSIRAAASATDTNYPTEKAVRTELDKKVPIYNEGSEVPSSQDLVCLRIKCPYVSGVNKSQVLLYDITSFADGTIVNNDGAYVTFKGFLIGGKPTGSGDAICVKICAKVAYTQISGSASFRTLKSDSSICGPEIIKRTEDGVDKYYLSIFYESTLFQGNDVLVGTFRWRAPNGISDYSYKNGVIGEYRPNQTYPANEPFWDRLISFTSNVAANTSASADKLSSSRKLKTNLARNADSTFDGSADQTNIPVTGTLPVGNGGTGAMNAIGAEYNILNQVADIDTTLNVDRKIALCNQTKSASNGVFRWIKLSNVWTLFKGLLSSESNVNISGTASGLSATLAVGKGGTGKTSVTSGNYVVGAGTSAMVEKTPKEVGSNVLSSLDTDSGDVVDNDLIVGTYHQNASTISTSTFVLRTASKLWNYIKSKLTGSDVNIGGNAATATNATTADTAKAYDTSFTGTDSIATKFGTKADDISYSDGRSDASLNLGARLLAGVLLPSSSLGSMRLSVVLAIDLSISGSDVKGGILRADVAMGSNGDYYAKKCWLTGVTGSLSVSDFKVAYGTGLGNKKAVGIIWDGTIDANRQMYARVIDYYAFGGDFVYNADVANVTASSFSASHVSAADDNVVHTTGDESVGGKKTFTDPVVESASTSGDYGGFFVQRGSTAATRYRVSLEVVDSGSRGLFDYGGSSYAGEDEWIIRKKSDNSINVGGASNRNKVSLGGVTLDFSGTVGNVADTFYIAN